MSTTTRVTHTDQTVVYTQQSAQATTQTDEAEYEPLPKGSPIASKERTSAPVEVRVTGVFKNQESRSECAAERYREDYDGQVVGLNKHLRARVQAFSNLGESILKTVIAAAQFVSTFVFFVVAALAETIKVKDAKSRAEEFFGVKIDADDRWDVLKPLAAGTLNSAHAIFSPQGAIDAGAKSDYIGTNHITFGTKYNKTTKTANWSLSSNWWYWAGKV